MTLVVERDAKMNCPKCEIMRNGLLDIAQFHVPDQPATSQADELSWVFQHVAALKVIALNALDRAQRAPLAKGDRP